MDLTKLKKLLEQYENAKTTLEEEAYLKAYFSSADVVPELDSFKEMFLYFQTVKKEVYPRDVKVDTKKKKPLKWVSIAASIVFLFSIITYTTNIIVGKQSKVTISSVDELPPKARSNYKEIEKVLKVFSTNLNKGTKAFANLYTYENSVNKIFNTNITTKLNP